MSERPPITCDCDDPDPFSKKVLSSEYEKVIACGNCGEIEPVA